MDSPLASRLIDIWTEWLSTCDATIASLHEQTAALVLRDPDKLQQVRMASQEGIDSLRFMDRLASDAIEELAADLETAVDVIAISRALPKLEGEKLHALANQVAVSARYLASVQAKNLNLAAA